MCEEKAAAKTEARVEWNHPSGQSPLHYSEARTASGFLIFSMLGVAAQLFLFQLFRSISLKPLFLSQTIQGKQSVPTDID
jgi:hypothetical protein